MEVMVDKIDVGLGDKKISRMILGTNALYYKKNCAEILNNAIKHGINTFDLAPSHLSNDHVKEWLVNLRENDPETFNSLVFILKGGFPTETKPGHYKSLLKGDSITIAQKAQKNLVDDLEFYGLQKVDIFMLHRDDEDYEVNKIIKRDKTSVKTICDAMKVLKPLYNICAISNWSDERTLEFSKIMGGKLITSSYFSLWERTELPWTGEYSFKHKDLMNESYMPNCLTMPYSTLGGYFGSRISLYGVDEAKTKYLDEIDPDQDPNARLLINDANRLKYTKLVDFTKKLNKERKSHYNQLQVVLAYSLAHTKSAAAFYCVDSLEYLEDNFEGYCLSKTLTKEDIEALS